MSLGDVAAQRYIEKREEIDFSRNVILAGWSRFLSFVSFH